MRKMIVTGHLGTDPEVRTTKNGNNYTTFRIANNEYGEDNASWITVTVWDSTQQNFCKNLKKGYSVIVDGDYSDRIYTNKAGQPEISRDLRSNAIYFGGSQKREEDTTSQQPQPQVAVVTPKQTTIAPTAASVQVVQETTSPLPVQEDDSDLPF